MNLKYLNYSFKDLVKRTKLTWHELDFAYKQSIAERQDVVAFAVDVLEEEMLGYEQVLELAIIEEYEEISSVLNALLGIEPPQEEKEIKGKWLYLLLADLYENRKDYENALAVVEELYADFDYPEEITNFVRYMPSEEAKKLTEQANVERLISNWKKYLDNFSNVL